jgi:cell division protein FtsL
MLFGTHSKRMIFNKKVKIKKCLFLIFFLKNIICFVWLCWYSSQQRQAFLKRKKLFLKRKRKKEKENCGSIKMFTKMIDVHQHFYS